MGGSLVALDVSSGGVTRLSGQVDRAEVDAAWRGELRRRIDDIESGKVELLDADEVHAQIRAELAAMRK